MLYAICYDIADDKRRHRIADILLGYGERVQYSVFEADIDPSQMEILQKQVRREMDENCDSLRIYFLCETCREKIAIFGTGQITDYPDVVIV